MQVKIDLNGKERVVTIKGIKKKYRGEYLDKLLVMEKASEDKDLSTEEKLKAATEFLDWVESLAIEYSDLKEEEKEELDIEACDILRDEVRELLSPVSETKKK